MSRSKASSRARRWARILYKPQSLAVAAIVMGVFISAPHVRRLSKELLKQQVYLVEGGDIRVTKPHAWVGRDFFEAAIESAELSTRLSVADPTLVPKLRIGLEASPWVESVDEITASLRDGLQIHLTYRTPAMMVQTLDGLFPVDAHGVVLPSDDFSEADANAFPRLVVYDLAFPGRVGTRWRDDRVTAAAEMSSKLFEVGQEDSIWQRCELAQIRPSETEDGVFELFAHNGSRVVWGHVGVLAKDIEPTAKDKIAKLDQIIAERGALDAPAGPYLIDLRRWDVVTLEPLAVSIR